MRVPASPTVIGLVAYVCTSAIVTFFLFVVGPHCKTDTEPQLYRPGFAPHAGLVQNSRMHLRSSWSRRDENCFVFFFGDFETCLVFSANTIGSKRAPRVRVSKS